MHILTVVVEVSGSVCVLAGFVEEMRFAAMKLHTKDQAPKEGQQQAHEQWNKVTLPVSVPAIP